MKRLKEVLEAFLRSAGLEKGVSQQTALLIWKDVVGEAIAKNTTPDNVEHGVLTVKTSNSSWRQELQFKKQDIVQKLNQALGSNIIQDIRFI